MGASRRSSSRSSASLRRKSAELDRPEVSAVINEIEADHATMDLQWSRLRERLDAIARGGQAFLSPADIEAFVMSRGRRSLVFLQQ